MRYLTESEIRSYARGCFQFRRTEQGVLPIRFRDEALAYYDSSDGWRIRARCPAGVVLDFVTDSDRVVVEAAMGESMRAYCAFDLMEGDRLAASAASREAVPELRAELHGAETGSRRLRLYLPHTRAPHLRVALADGASLAPAPAEPVLLTLGDSITQGVESLHPALTYPAVAARELGMTLFNYGIGGAIFAYESLPCRPIENPAIITVAYGINDWNGGRPVDHARAYLKRLAELYPAVPTAVLAPIHTTYPADRVVAGLTLTDYRRRLAEIVGEFPHMTCLAAERLMPADTTFLADNVHPSESGHVVYGQNLARLLRGTVQK